jgi:GNAT superfamily N-acetyltransferase
VLLEFIRAMAAVEKLTVSATEDSLRAALFGEAPAAHALLAFVGSTPIAYCTYCFTFATMVGKRVLWLDDLFVDPAFRGKGMGQALMAYLANIAVQNQCGRFEWTGTNPRLVFTCVWARRSSLIGACVDWTRRNCRTWPAS